MSPCSSANNEGRSGRGPQQVGGQAQGGERAAGDRRVRTWREGDEWSLTEEEIFDAVERQYGVVKYVSDFLGLDRAYIHERISHSPWLRFGLDQAKDDETADSTRHYRAALSAGKYWAISRHLQRQDRLERQMHELFVLELKLADRAAARNEARAAAGGRATATRQTTVGPAPSAAASDTRAADAPTLMTEDPGGASGILAASSVVTSNESAAPTLREAVANATFAEATDRANALQIPDNPLGSIPPAAPTLETFTPEQETLRADILRRKERRWNSMEQSFENAKAEEGGSPADQTRDAGYLPPSVRQELAQAGRTPEVQDGLRHRRQRPQGELRGGEESVLADGADTQRQPLCE